MGRDNKKRSKLKPKDTAKVRGQYNPKDDTLVDILVLEDNLRFDRTTPPKERVLLEQGDERYIGIMQFPYGDQSEIVCVGVLMGH